MPVAGPKVSSSIPSEDKQAVCFHCGEYCPDDSILLEEKLFCCTGCRTVYEILHANDLCRYYELDERAGISLRGQPKSEYAFLEEAEVRGRLIDFSDGQQSRVTFYLPQIHCASCIWLLENLYKLNEGILESKVHFLKREIYLTFREETTTLREIVELLARIGYPPAIHLSDLDKEERPVIDRPFFYKLGVAGFAFGNIMLLSFPEYLGLDETIDPSFARLFGYLNILLALPIVFYSGRDYLQSARLGIRQGMLNIDLPISLGILTLFGRSLYEILTHTGAGYLDSLAGLVFFLLIGKWFQQRTYHNISFERDYRSYFPIAARRKEGAAEKSVSLDKLKPGDVILVKHRELIPADSVLLRGKAQIDYSFVTGESAPVSRREGEQIFAGGRQLGDAIEVSLTKRVSQSYLTQLWNDRTFTKDTESRAGRLANKVGKYFTIAILLIAAATLTYWLPKDLPTAINAFTSVLIIACPCAVALAIPFIFGNAVRILGRHQFYLKNTQVIESISAFTGAVLDKTGTLTQRSDSQVQWIGEPLRREEKEALCELTRHSNHPVSQHVHQFLCGETGRAGPLPVEDWKEEVGKGLTASIGGRSYRLGAASLMQDLPATGDRNGAQAYVEIAGRLRGEFRIDPSFRQGTEAVISYFQERGPVFLLSGDNEREAKLLTPVFGDRDRLYFRQSPKDKLSFIRNLQKEGLQVLMLGDGLNDAGALKQSDTGIVIAEDTNNFTPACDAILRADQFGRLPRFIEFARRSIRLVLGAYAFALVYNVIGLSFAVQGTLSPIIAAILMPLSSISIVLFGMLASNWLARRMGLGE